MRPVQATYWHAIRIPCTEKRIILARQKHEQGVKPQSSVYMIGVGKSWGRDQNEHGIIYGSQGLL